MSGITLYGLDNCGTCDKAKAWLDRHGIAYRFVDYREHPVDPRLLTQWAATLGWEKLVNRASYTWRGLDEQQKAAASDAEWCALIAQHPALVKRPLVDREGSVSVGFSEKKFGELFPQ